MKEEILSLYDDNVFMGIVVFQEMIQVIVLLPLLPGKKEMGVIKWC